MREASPKPVMHCKTHVSSACAGTCDCTYKVERFGSMPKAISCAAPAMVRSRNSAGSCSTVIASAPLLEQDPAELREDRKSTRLNSSHVAISYAVFCLKKKN